MEPDMIELEPNRNAEAYRNYQPSSVPAHIEKCIDFIEFCDEGYMLLGCSNLTGRYWTGSLWYYIDPDSAPDVQRCLTGIECESDVCDGKFLRDRQRILVGEDSGGVQFLILCDSPDEHRFHFTCTASVCEHSDSVLSLAVFPDGVRAVTGSADMSIKVWDMVSMVADHTYSPAHTHHVTSVSIHPTEGNSTFVSCSLDGSALLWDIRNSKPATAIMKTKSALTSIAWQPKRDGIVAIGSNWGDITLMDVRHTKKILGQIIGFDRAIHRLRFADHQSNWLAACADDSPVKVFDCKSNIPTQIYVDDRHTDFVRGLAWNPKTKQLYSSGWDKTILHHTLEASPVHMEVNGVSPEFEEEKKTKIEDQGCIP